MHRFYCQAVLALSAVVAMSALSGCAVGVPSPTSMSLPNTEISTLTPTVVTSKPTATSSPTVTATATPYPTSLPDIPTPSLSHRVLDNLIFGGVSEDCQLPCWHGLRIGVSGRDDVQRMFNSVFGFSGFLWPLPDFFAPPPLGYQLVGHYWSIGKPYYGDFYMLVFINNVTEKLARLSFLFHTRMTEFHPDVRPQRIIKELGTPQQWLMAPLERGGQGDNFHLSVSSLMVYDNGELTFYHPMDWHVDEPIMQNGVETWNTEFCLDQYFDETVTIGEPLIDGFNKLTPLQETSFGIVRDMKPVQDILGVSAEDLAGWAVNESHPCIPVSYTVR